MLIKRYKFSRTYSIGFTRVFVEDGYLCNKCYYNDDCSNSNYELCKLANCCGELFKEKYNYAYLKIKID